MGAVNILVYLLRLFSPFIAFYLANSLLSPFDGVLRVELLDQRVQRFKTLVMYY